jgi:hypothetical protein
MSKMVRESLEASLNGGGNQAWRKYVGIIKGGPRDLSTRKGFSRG